MISALFGLAPLGARRRRGLGCGLRQGLVRHTKKPPASRARWFSLHGLIDLLPGLSGPVRRPHRTGRKGWAKDSRRRCEERSAQSGPGLNARLRVQAEVLVEPSAAQLVEVLTGRTREKLAPPSELIRYSIVKESCASAHVRSVTPGPFPPLDRRRSQGRVPLLPVPSRRATSRRRRRRPSRPRASSPRASRTCARLVLSLYAWMLAVTPPGASPSLAAKLRVLPSPTSDESG